MKRTKEFCLLIKINTTMHFGHPEEDTRNAIMIELCLVVSSSIEGEGNN